MATIDELGQALLNADRAGDTVAAQALADAIRQMGVSTPVTPPKQSTIMGEVARGAKQLLSSGRTGIESLTSPEAAAVAGIERSKKIGEEAGEGVSLEAVKKAYNKDGLLSAAGEAVSQIPRAVAGQIPQIGAMLAMGRIGAGVGSLAGPAGAIAGGIAGAGLALLPGFAGSNVEEQARAQQEAGQPVDINRTAAYSAAAAQAALEGAGTAFTLGKGIVKSALGIAEDAALSSTKAKEELAKAAARSLAAAAGVGAKRGAVELPVEVAQQVLERAQAGRDLLSQDAINAYGETLYQTLLVGPTIGGVAGVQERGQAKAALADKEQTTALAREVQRRRLAEAEAKAKGEEAPPPPTAPAEPPSPPAFQEAQPTPPTLPALPAPPTVDEQQPAPPTPPAPVEPPTPAAPVEQLAPPAAVEQAPAPEQAIPATEPQNVQVPPPATSEAIVGPTEPSVPVSDGQPEVPAGQPKSLKARALERAGELAGPAITGETTEPVALTPVEAAPVETVKSAPTNPMMKLDSDALVNILDTEKDEGRYYDALHALDTKWAEDGDIKADEYFKENPQSSADKAELAKRNENIPKFRFTRTELPVGTKYINKKQTEGVINKLTSSWTNMPPTEVVENVDGLPADLRTALDQAKDPVAARKGAKAVYYQGKVWVVSDNHASTGDVITSIMHEVAGHHGLKGVLGNEFDSTMKSIYDTNPDVRAEADAMMAKEKDLTTALATEEVLADRAETGKLSASILTRIANAVRRAVRTLSGGKYAASISNNEVRGLIVEARRFVKKGKKTSVEASGTIKQRSTLEESAAEFGEQDKTRAEQSTINRIFKGAIEGSKEVGLYQYLRTQIVDSASTIEEKMSRIFTEGTKDFFGNYNPLMLLRQSRDINKLLKPFYDLGDITQLEDGTFQAVKSKDDSSVRAIVDHISAVAKARGITFDQARARMNPLLEANRLWHLREANNKEGAEFKLHPIYPDSPKSIDEQIDAGKALFDTSPEAQKMLQLMDSVRFTLIDRMVEAGRLSVEEGQIWKDASGYVAFDRLAAPSIKKKLKSGKGIGRLSKMPEFQGSNKYAVGDLFENMLSTYGWMIGETVNNQARAKILDTMRLANFAKKRGDWNNVKNRETAVRAFEDGKEVWYELRDRIDMLAFDEGITGAGMTTTTKVLSNISNVMRTTVTATPMFTLKQVIDDSTRIMFYPGLKNPISAAVSMLWNFPKFAAVAVFPKNSPMRKLLEAMGSAIGTKGVLEETQRRKEELESKGITGEFDFNAASPAASYLRDLGIEKRGLGKGFLHAMEELARASDIAARSVVYEQSKKEGTSESQASTRARELINFRRQGASSTIQFFTTTVPFFNAAIQGTDLLLRAITGTGMGPSAGNNAVGRKQFLSRGMTMAAMSLVYTMMMADDDEYRNASQAVKDKNIIGPYGFKFPLPQEIAIIFKGIPERVYLHLRESANKEGKSDIDAVMSALKDALLAMTPGIPIPVALRPVAEAFTNYSFLTGRELEGTYQQSLPSAMRYKDTTSELAKAIGVYADVSPIKVDNFLTSWFGMTGSLVSMVADGLMNPNSAERPIHKLPFANIVTYDAAAQAQIADAFYDTAGKARAARNGLKVLEQENPEKAQAFYEKNAKLIALAPEAEHVLQMLEKFRKEEKAVRSSDMTPAEKRKALDEIRVDKNMAMAEAKSMQYFATH